MDLPGPRAPLRLRTSFVARFAHSRWPLSALLIGPLFLVAGAVLARVSAPFGIGGILIGLVVAVVALAAVLRAERPVAGDVVIDESGALLGSERLDRGLLRGAYFAPALGLLGAAVRVQGEGERPLADILVANEEQGQQIIDALGLGMDRSTARFSAIARWGSFASHALVALLALGLLAFFLAALLHSSLLAVLGVAIGIAAPIAFVPARIHVGADGFRIEERLGARFVPWSEVVSIAPYQRGVRVQLRHGEIFLPMYDRSERSALFARVSATIAGHRARTTPEVAARVARGARPVDAWIRGLFDRGGDFREAPLRDEPLWSVVENPGSGASARAGAAAVLARSGGEAERQRLRIAAASCASPRLRIALDRFAEGVDDDAMRELLGEIEDEEADGKGRATSGAAPG